MSKYGKYAGRQIVMQDLDDYVNDYIKNNMHELYKERNPPPPKDNTMKTINLLDGQIGKTSFQIRGSQEVLQQISAATNNDMAAMKININNYRVKMWTLIQFACLILTLKYEFFPWAAFAIIHTVINFDELRFQVKYRLKEVETYKEIVKEEDEKIVKGVIEK